MVNVESFTQFLNDYFVYLVVGGIVIVVLLWKAIAKARNKKKAIKNMVKNIEVKKNVEPTEELPKVEKPRNYQEPKVEKFDDDLSEMFKDMPKEEDKKTDFVEYSKKIAEDEEKLVKRMIEEEEHLVTELQSVKINKATVKNNGFQLAKLYRKYRMREQQLLNRLENIQRVKKDGESKAYISGRSEGPGQDQVQRPRENY